LIHFYKRAKTVGSVPAKAKNERETVSRV